MTLEAAENEKIVSVTFECIVVQTQYFKIKPPVQFFPMAESDLEIFFKS